LSDDVDILESVRSVRTELSFEDVLGLRLDQGTSLFADFPLRNGRSLLELTIIHD
jgi:hypothetical protein